MTSTNEPDKILKLDNSKNHSSNRNYLQSQSDKPLNNEHDFKPNKKI